MMSVAWSGRSALLYILGIGVDTSFLPFRPSPRPPSFSLTPLLRRWPKSQEGLGRKKGEGEEEKPDIFWGWTEEDEEGEGAEKEKSFTIDHTRYIGSESYMVSSPKFPPTAHKSCT